MTAKEVSFTMAHLVSCADNVVATETVSVSSRETSINRESCNVRVMAWLVGWKEKELQQRRKSHIRRNVEHGRQCQTESNA